MEATICSLKLSLTTAISLSLLPILVSVAITPPLPRGRSREEIQENLAPH